MAKVLNENWEMVINTTYEVCEDQMGRGKNFVDTLAKALNIAGDFQVTLLIFEIRAICKEALSDYRLFCYDSYFYFFQNWLLVNRNADIFDKVIY